MHDETGRPVDDAILEVVNTILHLDWAARHAQAVLRPRRGPSGIAMMNQAASVEYHPLGVIGPWNYPVFTPMGSIAYALAAGNAVVFKPSELTTGVGQWLVRSFASVPALPFGGSGESGFGRIHGADGLREFSRAKAITRQRMRPLVRTTTFERSDRDMKRIVRLVTVRHGRRSKPRRRQ